MKRPHYHDLYVIHRDDPAGLHYQLEGTPFLYPCEDQGCPADGDAVYIFAADEYRVIDEVLRTLVVDYSE